MRREWGVARNEVRVCGFSRELGMVWPHCRESLAWAYRELRLTGRGKHVGGYSYYHVLLAAERKDVLAYLVDLKHRMWSQPFEFNVVKLERRSRVSFLHYGDFGLPFPVLVRVLSCNLAHWTARVTSFSGRSNPPILHRKELLLPAGNPLVAKAVVLTEILEGNGAFTDTKRIGTRDGWAARLASLGLRISDEGGVWSANTRG